MKSICFFSISVVLFLGVARLVADAPQEEKSLDGMWTLVSGEADGKPLSKSQLEGGKLQLRGNEYAVTLADRGTVKGTLKVDATKDPATIDIKDADGPNQGQTCLGIWEQKGNRFRVAFASPGKPRPTKFATAPGQWMHVWKRVKE